MFKYQFVTHVCELKIFYICFRFQEIISDSKRIKLILKVFLTCNVKSEGLALEKFRVWWHFIRCLGRRCVPWFEPVSSLLIHIWNVTLYIYIEHVQENLLGLDWMT